MLRYDKMQKRARTDLFQRCTLEAEASAPCNEYYSMVEDEEQQEIPAERVVRFRRFDGTVLCQDVLDLYKWLRANPRGAVPVLECALDDADRKELIRRAEALLAPSEHRAQQTRFAYESAQVERNVDRQAEARARAQACIVAGTCAQLLADAIWNDDALQIKALCGVPPGETTAAQRRAARAEMQRSAGVNLDAPLGTPDPQPDLTIYPMLRETPIEFAVSALKIGALLALLECGAQPTDETLKDLRTHVQEDGYGQEPGERRDLLVLVYDKLVRAGRYDRHDKHALLDSALENDDDALVEALCDMLDVNRRPKPESSWDIRGTTLPFEHAVYQLAARSVAVLLACGATVSRKIYQVLRDGAEHSRLQRDERRQRVGAIFAALQQSAMEQERAAILRFVESGFF